MPHGQSIKNIILSERVCCLFEKRRRQSPLWSLEIDYCRRAEHNSAGFELLCCASGFWGRLLVSVFNVLDYFLSPYCTLSQMSIFCSKIQSDRILALKFKFSKQKFDLIGLF